MQDERYNPGFRIVGKDQSPVDWHNIEDKGMVDSEMTRAQSLMGEAIEHLHGRQKEVYELCMRDGKSLAQVGKILGITKATAQDHKERAIKFITAYCKAVIAKEEKHEAI